MKTDKWEINLCMGSLWWFEEKTALERKHSYSDSAVSIGKAHETANQEVQECCLKPPVSDSTNAVFKDKPNKGLVCNYCANKKGSHSFANKRHCFAWGAVCGLCKIINHLKDSKECKRLENERKAKPDKQWQSRSAKKQFVLKVDEDGEEHFYEVVDKICTLNQQCDHRKAFENLLISKKRISVNFRIDSGSTCSILPVGVYNGRSVVITTCKTSAQLSVQPFHSMMRKLRSTRWELEMFCVQPRLQLDKKWWFSLQLSMKTWPL